MLLKDNNYQEYPVGLFEELHNEEISTVLERDSNVSNSNDIDLYPFVVRENKLFKKVRSKDGEVKEVEVGHATLVDSIEVNIESHKIKLILRFFHPALKWKTLRVERGRLSKSELKLFLDHGVDIGGRGKKVDDVLEFIDLHENVAPKTYSHNKLGWIIFDSHLVFRLEQGYWKDEKLTSAYDGPLQVAPKGTYDQWLELVNQHVVGHTPMELMLAASFAAPIIGLLNVTEVAEVDSLLLNIVGNSTTGKTTAAMVAAAVFGSPSITSNGLIQTFNGTTNALQSIISGNTGVTLVFDETSMNMMGNKAFTSFIYKLAQNKDKARLNKEAELRETERWATVMLFTGESSILENANANEGLYVRLFEFKNVQWTKDANHSEVLKDGLTNNYGHAGIKYVQYLLNKKPDELKSIWLDFKEKLKEKLPDTKFTDRVSSKFAMLLTGAHLANEALGINLSLNEITRMLIEQEEASMDVRELAPKFHNQLLQYIIENQRSFKYKDHDIKNQLIFGKIEIDNDISYCYIFPNKLKEIANEFGFPDLKVLLEELKKRGLLKHDKEKLQIKRKIFTQDEEQSREKSLKKTGKAEKGDYTYCIVYQGDIFADFHTSEDVRDRKLANFDLNTPPSRKIKKSPKTDPFDDED